jgi:uncharacterized protein (DUF433 family)
MLEQLVTSASGICGGKPCVVIGDNCVDGRRLLVHVLALGDSSYRVTCGNSIHTL